MKAIYDTDERRRASSAAKDAERIRTAAERYRYDPAHSSVLFPGDAEGTGYPEIQALKQAIKLIVRRFTCLRSRRFVWLVANNKKEQPSVGSRLLLDGDILLPVVDTYRHLGY